MPNDDLSFIRHKVKGTLQQVDTVFELMLRLREANLQEAIDLKQELCASLERLAKELNDFEL